jgi:hypothetical protein
VEAEEKEEEEEEKEEKEKEEEEEERVCVITDLKRHARPAVAWRLAA